MRHVAIFGDDLEALDGLFVADYVAEVEWAVLFHPGNFIRRSRAGGKRGALPGEIGSRAIDVGFETVTSSGRFSGRHECAIDVRTASVTVVGYLGYWSEMNLVH